MKYLLDQAIKYCMNIMERVYCKLILMTSRAVLAGTSCAQ